MTVPFHRADAAAAEVKKAGIFIKADWQRYLGVVTHPDNILAHEMHLEGLRDAWLILDALGDVSADDLAALMKLRAEKPADFTAIMVLVRIELERPAPAEQAQAA